MNFLYHCVFTYKSVPLILKEFFSLHSHIPIAFLSLIHSHHCRFSFLWSKQNYLHLHAHSQRAPCRRTRKKIHSSPQCSAFPSLCALFFSGWKTFSCSQLIKFNLQWWMAFSFYQWKCISVQRRFFSHSLSPSWYLAKSYWTKSFVKRKRATFCNQISTHW